MTVHKDDRLIIITESTAIDSVARPGVNLDTLDTRGERIAFNHLRVSASIPVDVTPTRPACQIAINGKPANDHASRARSIKKVIGMRGFEF
jgi:hypothetical protein